MSAREFGRYRLDRRLGRGAAGEVWLAYDPTDARTVALKILSGSAAEDADYRRRFEREARIGARLTDPHIAPIHHFGEYGGRLYLDMAYIPGLDVARLIRSRPMSVAEAVDIVSQVAEALDAAHAAGLVHRDVKPANIIVHTSGFAYLIDFGIARAAGQTTITATGFTVGTLAYMAPERFTGHGDGRSDVYSLACVLYECLTARRPFGDTDAVQQLHAHLHQPPPRPSAVDGRIPAALDAVIARGMAKRPDDRYRTAGELAGAARAAIGATPVPRTPPVLQPESAADTTAALPPEPVGPRPTLVLPGAVTEGGAQAAPRRRGTPPTAPGPAGHHDIPVPRGPVPPVTRHPRPAPARSGTATPETLGAQSFSRPARRRPRFAPVVALIGAAIVLLAVVAGCTALLNGGGIYVRTPSDPGATTLPAAPPTEAPTTPEPEYTTAVVPPRWTIPLPTGILPPFQIPGAAAHPADR
ncbi:serine/threonine-protein kinase [Nocardia veterana]|uniref:non-specific serine/threonine protein kinase n=1 Tax=Nocardia veterana TaxID=132249 RepID=A0A7X6LZ45_9NOCA|nr:serine/threonine-protein kinase [Nocardia veterana]NKY86427.1 protein kinase [Nocardia veterana]